MSLIANSSVDDFDTIPDPFENEDIDWAQLLSAPQAITTPPSSPEYFPNEPLDDAFLAELDLLDNPNTPSGSNAVSTVPPQSTTSTSNVSQAHTTTPIIQPASPFPSTAPSTPPRLSTKRRRTVSEDGSIPTSSPRKSSPDTSSQSGRKRKRMKSTDVILTALEEELTCPICCDIFVATHLLNPCGHSFCGDCSWQWVMKNRNTACPICRTRLSTMAPMTPNISLDKTIDLHIRMLSTYSDIEWQTGGAKLVEFRERERKWKESVAQRRRESRVPGVIKPPVWVIVSDEEDEEDEEDDEDYEDYYEYPDLMITV
ncbi:hypothetical protein C8R45DRAFT_23359 [Mycena sanguinolenta]|nr:hypothetical protein C8R45DRAFT_23359 [Mycena sanguinolenta]